MLRIALLAAAAALLLSFPATGQDYTAKTAGNPDVTISILEIELQPLQLDELEVEAKAWVALLATQNKQISAARIANQGAAPSAADVAAQAALAQRLHTVLAAMKALGGDTKSYEKYITASTGTSIDFADAAGVLHLAKDWLISPEGGMALAFNLLKFFLTLIAFKIVAGILGRIVRKAISRTKGTSELLRDFFVNTVRKVTFFIGLIIALSMLGVQIGPFLAAIGAAGFIIGFALQGTLSNFAAGIMILIYQPYDIGQVVTVAGTTGKVDDMSLVSTTLRLPDNQTVVVPNNSIWGDVITNITGQTTRRVDMVFGCGYDDDLQAAQKVLEDIIAKHPKVHAEPAPVIKVHELADSSVNFVVRPWTNTSDYWDVFWDVTREVKERFDQAGLNIPYPQQEVHMHQINTV